MADLEYSRQRQARLKLAKHIPFTKEAAPNLSGLNDVQTGVIPVFSLRRQHPAYDFPYLGKQSMNPGEEHLKGRA